MQQVFERVRSGDTLATIGVIALVAVLIALIAFIVFVESGRRKIPISYAKRHVGRQLVAGQQTNMPLKVNMGGVIPVIFASSFLALPQTFLQFFPYDVNNPSSWQSKINGFFQQFQGGSLLRADFYFADHRVHLLLYYNCFQR
ncbi:MAG: SecY family transport protein [Pyrinomonadaceae bacterium]